MRCSRSRAASAPLRILVVRLPITSATTSITPKVRTYRASETEKVKWGETKKKSKEAMPSSAAATAGPWRYRAAATTTARR